MSDNDRLEALTAGDLEVCRRELKAIYAIDQLRDTVRSPEAFLNGCAATIRSLLDPDLLQIITLDMDDCPAQHITMQRWETASAAELLQAISAALSAGQSSTLQVESGEIVINALKVNGERLGVLVVGRRAAAWSRTDRVVINALCSQIDSAIEALRVLHQLHNRNRELETIYRLDRLIDSTPDFNVALSEALILMAETINASWSFIMLYAPDERELELRAVSDHTLTEQSSEFLQTLRGLARETISAEKLVRRESIGEQIGAYIGVPLILQNQIIGVFGGINPPGQRGFGSDQVKMLRAITSQMDTALFEDRRQRHIRETFARYVSPAVVDLMLSTANQDFLQVHRQALTMLFSDMRGFTTISEQLEPDVVAAMLNEHLAVMTSIIRDAGGTVDKFVGDEVVAFFGAPLQRSDHALLAVRTALRMQQAQQEIMQAWQARGLPPVPIGIGVGTGEVIVGNIGSAQMMNYTAIGPDVNLAARLCGAAEPNQILINHATYTAVRDHVTAVPVEPLTLRHIALPVQAYSVTMLAAE